MRKTTETPLSRAESIRSALEEDILTGTLQPGEALDERSLGERFGVSRTPVRQALSMLSSQGLLKVVPRVGVVVPRLSSKDLLASLEMLAELEGICAKFAARRMGAEERAALREVVVACETAVATVTPKAYAAANKRFHEIIYSGARNEWAAEQVRNLRLRSVNYQLTRFEVPGRIEKSLRDHQAIMAAIESGDGEAARLAMIEHISVGGSDFADLLSTLAPGQLADG